jgi:outer membrane cobalamin receptor
MKANITQHVETKCFRLIKLFCDFFSGIFSIKRRKHFVSTLLLFSASSFAQDSIKNINDISIEDEFSIEELMNVKLTVGAQKELTAWQTPSCVSVFTKEDIEKTAARDLLDILRLIPGLEFAQDVYGGIGIGMRGNWGTEGKVLILLDGLQMNENMYGTSQWIGHYDIAQIERIEIVRGPGYAYYNGLASLGVINIITKNGKQMQGVQANGTYGQLNNSLGRATGSIGAGFNKNDLDVSAFVYGGALYRFAGNYTDYYGESSTLNSGVNNLATPLQIKLKAEYKGLTVKYLHDDYNYKTRTPYSGTLINPTSVNFATRQFDISYNWKINDKIKIKPSFNMNYNRPWLSNQIQDTIDPNYSFYDKYIIRYTAAINSNIKLHDYVQLNLGVGHFYDDAHAQTKNTTAFNAAIPEAQYYTIYDYAELFLDRKNTTASLGMRNENHNLFGSVFLPRLAATQRVKKFNFKGSYSHAFRAPMAENFISNPHLKPEKTIVTELEVDYQINEHWLASANIFDIDIINPIIFGTLNNQDQYNNFSKLGTQGVETEIKYLQKNFRATANYSYYENTEHDVVTYVSPSSTSLLGFANHKASANVWIKLSEQISLSSSIVCLSGKYAKTDTLGTLSLLNPSYTVNSKITIANIKALKGLTFDVGCYNVFNSSYQYVQAYQADLPPISSLGREFVLNIKYVFSKNEN